MANQYERMRPPTDRRGNKILSEFQQNVKLQKNPEMVSKKQFFIYYRGHTLQSYVRFSE